MRSMQHLGYSSGLADMYLSPKIIEAKKCILLSTQLKPKYVWEDNKPTDKVESYQILCGIPNDTFYVKLPKKIALPAYQTPISFDGLEACESHNTVYFRCQSIKEVE